MFEYALYWVLITVCGGGLIVAINSLLTSSKLSIPKNKLLLFVVSITASVVFLIFINQIIPSFVFLDQPKEKFISFLVLFSLFLIHGLRVFTKNIVDMDEKCVRKRTSSACKYDIPKETLESHQFRKENLKTMHEMSTCINTLKTHSERVKNRVTRIKGDKEQDESI